MARTIKFTMEPTPMMKQFLEGNKFQLSTEVVVDSEEEAYEAGQESFTLLMSFMNGFSSSTNES